MGRSEYDPEKREITREEFVYLGSDSYYTQVGTGTFEMVDRWSRICKICGKKEHTYEQEEVAVRTIKRPRFKKIYIMHKDFVIMQVCLLN